MSLLARQESESTDFEPIPAGSWGARCIGIYDIGTQYNKMFDNWKRQCIVTWEVPEHTYESEEGSRPMTISKWYTVSLNEKANLYKDLVSWRGKEFTHRELVGFELSCLAGQTCLLGVVHKDDRQRVQNVMKLPSGMEVPDASHPVVVYDMSEDPDGDKAEELPEWIQNQIAKSRERGPMGDTGGRDYQLERTHQPTGEATPEAVATVKAGAGADEEDDIPF